MRYKIGVIIHYKEMSEKFAHLAKQMDCDLFFEVGVMDYAIDIAISLENDSNVDAIIASTATADIVRDFVSIPVVPIHIKDYNIVEALLKSKKLGEKIAFCDINPDRHYDLDHLAKILNVEITQYPFSSIYKTNEVVSQIAKDGGRIVLTPASCMYNSAKKNNLDSVLIRITEQDIIDAIETARFTIEFRNREIEKNRWLSSVVDLIDECVITTDTSDTITLINKSACNYLHVKPENIIGCPLSTLQNKFSILKALSSENEPFDVIKTTIPQQSLVVNKEIIKSNLTNFGVLYRFSELKNLQKKEMLTRRKIHENGFFAANTFANIIGESDSIKKVKTQAQRYAKTDSTVLIQGESGTGKELFAQSIHNASLCSSGPFVAINCAALPESLLDSELFGYEDGSFTGAKKGGKEGLFEIAHGGTIFLDEISEMPIHLQSKLLRVLQERQVRRIGGSRTIPISVRIIAATNQNLFSLVKENLFREDLYYRLNVLFFEIPPLRQRKEDIPLLLNTLSNNGYGISDFVSKFTPEQLSVVKAYDWNGNIRELKNFVERINALGYSYHIGNQYIDGILTNMVQTNPHVTNSQPDNSNSILVPIDTMEKIEIFIISKLMERFNGNRHQVCFTLDISNTTLWRKIKSSPEK